MTALPCPADLMRLRSATQWLRETSLAADRLAIDTYALIAKRAPDGSVFLSGTMTCGGTLHVEAGPRDITMTATRGDATPPAPPQQIIRKPLPARLRREPMVMQ
jgi:hypothetical protein